MPLQRSAETTGLQEMLHRLVDDEAGTTAIEYALIGTVVSIGIIVSINAFATAESALFSYIAATVTGAIGS